MKRYEILTRIKNYLDTELAEAERWIEIGKLKQYPPEHLPMIVIIPDEYEEVVSRLDLAPPMYEKELDIQIGCIERYEENENPEYTADRIMSRVIYAMENYRSFNPDNLVVTYGLFRQGVVPDNDIVTGILHYRFNYVEESGKIDVNT